MKSLGFIPLVVGFLLMRVSAAPSASIQLLGPVDPNAPGNGDLILTTVVTNTGTETLRLLRDPNSVLSSLEKTNLFTFYSAIGPPPPFIGQVAKYVPSVTAARGLYTELLVGQSISRNHVLTDTYDFTSSAPGMYRVSVSLNLLAVSLTNNTIFTIVASPHEPLSITIIDMPPPTAPPIAHRQLSSTDSIPSPDAPSILETPESETDATYIECSADEQTKLVAAAQGAQDYASNAASYASANAQNSEASRSRMWFGTYDADRYQTVQSHFSSINGSSFESYTCDCTCTDENVYAYVYPSKFARVYLCQGFWRAPTTGTDSQSGTLIHESSHFTQNGGTHDHAYGESKCLELAVNGPADTIDNADSHEYFSENVVDVQAITEPGI